MWKGFRALDFLTALGEKGKDTWSCLHTLWARGAAVPHVGRCLGSHAKEGGLAVAALKAGWPFGIWQHCAWVPRFKELSKNPSIWACLLLLEWQGADQMVHNKTTSEEREKGTSPK